MATQKKRIKSSAGPEVRIGISSCLLRNNVRYDGGNKLDHYLRDTLGQFVKWVPVCPEAECGLPVPREAMNLTGDPDSPRLLTRFTNKDHTEQITAWAQKKLARLEKQDLSGFVFKARSPSCAVRDAKIHSKTGSAFRTGPGIFARSFMDRFPLIPADDEETLHFPLLRENFIERVFTYRRWQELVDKGGAIEDLVSFHAAHKYLIMSHSSKHLRELGALIANQNKYGRAELLARYFLILMHGMSVFCSRKTHTDVLQHMAGYFKKQLSPREKKQLTELIGQYHNGLVPLIMPITLIRHYAEKFDQPYLKEQHYLNPHPAELMLSNHV